MIRVNTHLSHSVTVMVFICVLICMSEQMQEDQTEDLICSHKATDLVAFYKFTQVSSVDLSKKPF